MPPAGGGPNPSCAADRRPMGKEVPTMDSRDIETYYDNGSWKNRRGDCDQPFSSGP
jgi:hypothetical protein